MLVIILLCITPVHSLMFSEKGRYIPNIKVAEEIDVSDVTFTTPPSDSDHFKSIVDVGPKATSTHARVLPKRQRTIVPVTIYHKVNHPFVEILRPAGSNPSTGYEKKNYASPMPVSDLYKNFHARKKSIYGPKIKSTAAGGLHSAGSKYVISPTRHLHTPGPIYQVHTNGIPVRLAYYLVGDDSNIHAGSDTNDDSASRFNGKRFYNEKDFHSVKPNIKYPYRKKYSPFFVKKYNNKVRPMRGGFSSDDDRTAPDDSDDDHHLTSENATRHQAMDNEDADGRSGDLKAYGGDRVEFQMYGMDGPNSYKFGYDTGKGDNRHFRFEERDNDGKIKGRYGYMDEEGKMRVVKYEADPEKGFHADPVEYSSKEANE